MKSYMIVTAVITDRAGFAEYSAKTPKVVESFGGKYICLGRHASLFEGSFGEGQSIVISEWPSREAIDQFWNSPDYQKLKQLRAGTGSFNVLVVDNLKPL